VAVDPLGAELDDGRQMTSQLFVSLLTEEMADLRRDFASPRLEEAALLFSRMVLSDTLEEFLTLPAYELIGLPDRLIQIPDLDLEPEFVPGSGSLRIELVGAERLEMGERLLPAAWVAFDADTAPDCDQLAPTPIAAMDHDLAGG
jgi:hypothetical protein